MWLERLLETAIHVFHTWPALIISVALLTLGFLFILWSWMGTLWNVELSCRIGPIAMILVAVVIGWTHLPQEAREGVVEWIRTSGGESMTTTKTMM